MSDIGPVPEKQPDNPAIINGVRASKHAVWLPKTLKQSRVTEYFSADENRPWSLLAKEKPHTGKRHQTHEEHIRKQRRILSYLIGADKLTCLPFDLRYAAMRVSGETPEQSMQDMMQARLWRSYDPLFEGVKASELQIPADGAIDEALSKPQNEVAAEQPAADGSDTDYEDDDEPAPQPANRQPRNVHSSRSLQEFALSTMDELRHMRHRTALLSRMAHIFQQQ